MKCYAEKCPYGPKPNGMNCGDFYLCKFFIPEPEQAATAPVDSQSTGSVSVKTDKKHFGRVRGMPYDCPVCCVGIGNGDNFCAQCGAKLVFTR